MINVTTMRLHAMGNTPNANIFIEREGSLGPRWQGSYWSGVQPCG